MTVRDPVVYLLLECGLIPTTTGGILTEDGITHRAFVERSRAVEYANRKVLEGGFIAWRIVERVLDADAPVEDRLHLVCEVFWHHPNFARHPTGGVPRYAFRQAAAAESACLELNQADQADRCPFDHPPRSVLALNSAAWIRWNEDEPLLRVLIDYVQDLGLPPLRGPEPLVTAWKLWWHRIRPEMEPWQWQAIWAFLDRLPRYRVCTIDCDTRF